MIEMPFKLVVVHDVFLSLLTVLFVGLKLTGHIGWSWWLVLAPLWFPVTALLVVGLLLAAVGQALEAIGK